MKHSRSKKQHGGQRLGAGRPPIPEEERLVRRTYRLRQDEWEALEALGNGDVREGIRLLLARKIRATSGKKS